MPVDDASSIRLAEDLGIKGVLQKFNADAWSDFLIRSHPGARFANSRSVLGSLLARDPRPGCIRAVRQLRTFVAPGPRSRHERAGIVEENACVWGRLYEDYFDLQLRVATAYARLGGLTRSTAIARFTNLRRRFGLLGDSGAAEWESFLHSVPEDAEHEELLERALEWYEHAPTLRASPFGCFSYDPPDAHGILRIHFMPEEQHRRDSPLSDARISERRSELQAMIADVRHRYSNVRHVRGVSWLYNVHAYKRLFPPEYIASITLPAFVVNMNGSSTWGQVLDYRHEVKIHVRDHVLANVNTTTLPAPWRAFPLPALVAACAIECFQF